MAIRTQTHPVPCATTVARLSSHRDRLVTQVMKSIESDHIWYRALSAEDRSWVGLVAQASIDAFIGWCKDKSSSAASSQEIFAVAPAELTRTVSLHQTLLLVKSGVEVIEAEAEVLSAPGKAQELHDAVLRYSREFAFATAEVYARAAELRGSWDARLEALVVDSLIRGDVGASVRSRLAALGWSSTGQALAVVAGIDAPLGEGRVREVRSALRATARDWLAGFQSDRVLILLSGLDEFEPTVLAVLGALGGGPVVVGPKVASLDDLPRSIRAANAGLDSLAAWPAAPRPVLADDLLPERLLLGDPEASATLLDRAYRPLVEAGKDVALTLGAYLELGRSLEGAARVLFVHPNTVRYRLGKVSEICGWDPSDPREAYVLQHALALGRLAGANRQPVDGAS
ncbi:MAG: helix-turn-helix domain-containing protein [Bifidobacteriaceae bacterium]|jgi:DNA-binding PucR family transcriptional regulator|nr:helix-turn-helix domain-containing protein [Bifidobacteriaceae bacterium]